MRVISGVAKGIRLAQVPGEGTRPISDRVKESLFNILGEWIVGARVLDLFAGTGSVGIEALSRGAGEVLFVDKAAKAVRTVRDNLKRTRLGGPQAQVVKADAFQVLDAAPDAPFDLIYVAPPQYHGLWARALRAIDGQPAWLAQDGLVVVQIFPKEYEPLELETLAPVDERRYGSTLLVFYEKMPPASPEPVDGTAPPTDPTGAFPTG
jgi:16S rRNA (guanine966-N2)-methyltransferase